MLVPADSVMPEFYVSQRNRINITYRRRAVKFHASLQEIHLWGKSGDASSVGTIGAFEFYIESTVAKKFSFRVGRQGLTLDNGRLFSAAPWAQQGRAHEGIRLFYANKKVATDLMIAFTRPYSSYFNEAYSPVASHSYKWMFVHHLKYRLNNRFNLITINTADVFQNSAQRYYVRATIGGRLEYTHRDTYLTVSSYYQFGEDSGLRNIQAYYIQPEVSTTAIRNTTVRLGAEILSGGDGLHEDISFSFVPLYGVAWKFMGNMNLFTRFPGDVNGKGLVNPYLFIIYRPAKNFSLRVDSHLFYSQYPLLDSNNDEAGRYLGFENDLSINYKPAKNVDMTLGLSYLFAEKSMELLHKVVDSDRIPIWSYLMISYNPKILHHKSSR